MKKLSFLFIITTTAFIMYGCNNTNRHTTKNITVNENEARFTVTAATSGMARVAVSKYALDYAQNYDVREFANRVVIDHSKANEVLTDIAQEKNIPLPSSTDSTRKLWRQPFSKLRGTAFDRAYINAMTTDHKKTLELMQSEIKYGKDAELKAFAAKTAATLKAHLLQIDTINITLK
jgi:putative membrane protein